MKAVLAATFVGTTSVKGAAAAFIASILLAVVVTAAFDASTAVAVSAYSLVLTRLATALTISGPDCSSGGSRVRCRRVKFDRLLPSLPNHSQNKIARCRRAKRSLVSSDMSSVVLIVEDDFAIRKGMLALLRMQGHTVDTAVTIADAQQKLNTQVPTHLILDLNLPDGLGTDLLRYIRKQGISTRIMLLTGSSDTPALAEARTLGVDSIVLKPPDWDKVIEWASC